MQRFIFQVQIFQVYKLLQLRVVALQALAGNMANVFPELPVTFDNVKVQGPDGEVRPIPGPGFILY